MKKYAINPDGFVVPYGAAIESKTWEGGVKTEKKHYKPQNIELRVQERVKLKKFMSSQPVRDYLSSRPVEIRSDREAMLKDAAAKELKAVFEASLALVKEGKEELEPGEYRLHFNPQTGIVKSEYRRKEDIKNSREAQRVAVEMANEVFEL